MFVEVFNSSFWSLAQKTKYSGWRKGEKKKKENLRFRSKLEDLLAVRLGKATCGRVRSPTSVFTLREHF